MVHICTAPNPFLSIEELLLHFYNIYFGNKLCHRTAATYAKRCAKMSTLRNVCFENPEKKVCISGKVTFYEKPCIFFLIFNISGKSMKQKLLEMFQVTVPIFFYFDEI